MATETRFEAFWERAEKLTRFLYDPAP